MSQSGTGKPVKARTYTDKPRITQEYNAKLIRQLAKAKGIKRNAATDGDAPDDPIHEIGRAR